MLSFFFFPHVYISMILGSFLVFPCMYSLFSLSPLYLCIVLILPVCVLSHPWNLYFPILPMCTFLSHSPRNFNEDPIHTKFYVFVFPNPSLLTLQCYKVSSFPFVKFVHILCRIESSAEFSFMSTDNERMFVISSQIFVISPQNYFHFGALPSFFLSFFVNMERIGENTFW